MPKRTTIVTAIPYVNNKPHIGTVLTDLAGDITARYFRMRGDDVFFVAGTDENGLKIKEAAEAAGRDPLEFVADLAGVFQSIFREMGISYDEFIRTTQPRHVACAQHFFKVLLDNGHIYRGTYEGWYDVSTETFYKEADLVDGKSPDGNPVRWVSEQNYFFRLSAFEKALLELIENNPHFIVPESRRNEVICFIRQGLRDVAISRQNPGWGIPIPGEEDQVIYVWFDALINYVTASGWPAEGWDDKWPPIVQWVGKDILTRFHATLWPAMLMGVGLPLPQAVAAHAWILLGSGEKISKSKGNQVEPLVLAQDLADRAGCPLPIAIDALRHYLTSTMPYENDSTFTYADFDRRYNSDLANDLGNAVNRTLSIVHRFGSGTVPAGDVEPAAKEAIDFACLSYQAGMEAYRLERASDAALGLVRFLNKYIDTRAPWAMAKGGDPDLPAVLKSMLLCIRTSEGLFRAEMPNAADLIAEQLGLPPLTEWKHVGWPDSLPSGTKIGQPAPIFPRLESAQTPPRSGSVADARSAGGSAAGTGSGASGKAPSLASTAQSRNGVDPGGAAESKKMEEITIDDFAKVQLRVGRVLEAEPIEGADKLLKLQVVIGSEQRQIVAGIRKNYTPEDLIGRQVIVVANLRPAKLRGVDSQGMLLAAVDADGGAILLQPDAETPEGATVR